MLPEISSRYLLAGTLGSGLKNQCIGHVVLHTQPIVKTYRRRIIYQFAILPIIGHGDQMSPQIK